VIDSEPFAMDATDAGVVRTASQPVGERGWVGELEGLLDDTFARG
jgi:hypothetical protein